jgi:hypothetical protein
MDRASAHSLRTFAQTRRWGADLRINVIAIQSIAEGHSSSTGMARRAAMVGVIARNAAPLGALSHATSVALPTFVVVRSDTFADGDLFLTEEQPLLVFAGVF